MSRRRDAWALLRTLVRFVLAVLGGLYGALVWALSWLTRRVAAAVADHPLVERADDTVMGTIYDELADPRVRQRVEELFSRRVLGSVLIAATTTRVIEVSVGVAFGELSWLRIPVWIVIWVSAVALFVWWDRVENRATGTADPDSATLEELEVDARGTGPRRDEGETTLCEFCDRSHGADSSDSSDSSASSDSSDTPDSSDSSASHDSDMGDGDDGG